VTADEDRTGRAALGAALADVRRRVATACAAAGRDPHEVRILLATKTVPAATVRLALEADAAARAADPTLPSVLVGENRVQELVVKGPDLADLAPTTHLIGPLQTNKVNAALRWASCVQSVASVDLATRLAARVDPARAPLDVLVQVNVSGEPTKNGVSPAEAAALADRVAALGSLRLAGFMTVGANSPDTVRIRDGYALLREIRDATLTAGHATARELSMGMSRDLEVAVAEGATMVRVGTAVFGARPTPVA